MLYEIFIVKLILACFSKFILSASNFKRPWNRIQSFLNFLNKINQTEFLIKQAREEILKKRRLINLNDHFPFCVTKCLYFWAP